jgi:membrane-bound metal-dependent hydrolase YbcI (DUF457 family)
VPFTPFHFGPAIGFGLPLRKYLHVPTFIVANVIVDVEPLLVLVLGLNYPLHGYLHTFIFASLTGLALGYVLFSFDRLLHPIYKAMKLVVVNKQSFKSYMAAGVLGATFHVLLDSPLYRDIKPLYPFTHNPFYNPNLSSGVYSFCVWMGIIGIIYYIGLFIYPLLRRQQPN